MHTRSFVLLFTVVSIGAHAQSGAGGPCAVLTKAEVQEVSGLSVSDGVTNTYNKSVCEFKAGAAGSVSILLERRTQLLAQDIQAIRFPQNNWTQIHSPLNARSQAGSTMSLVDSRSQKTERP
jgi:hypothetical protein